MTIKFDREALICVLDQTPSSGALSSSDYRLVDYGNLISSSRNQEKLRYRSNDDEDSIYTSSTASFSDTDSEDDVSFERRVTFREELVSDVWTRPYTAKEDLSTLYYTTEETQKFRQEYRLERKLLSEMSINVDSHLLEDNDELSALASKCGQLAVRHSISRVVVVHNDKLETFFTPPEVPVGSDQGCDAFFDNDSFWSGSITWY